MVCPSCGKEIRAGAEYCSDCDVQLVADNITPISNDISVNDSNTAGSDWNNEFVFMGREQELEQLGIGLKSSHAGDGRLVMIGGEPGIGKTSTATKTAIIAREQKFEDFTGLCYEGRGALPYWPWIQTIRQYLDKHSDDEIQSCMGVGASFIAGIVPEVREYFPELPEPPSLDSEQLRFRLFDAVMTFLRNASRKSPILLIIENLHAADYSSLGLLEFIAGQLNNAKLMIIGTYRSTEVSDALQSTLGKLAGEQPFSRIELSGLSLEETENLIRAAIDQNPPRSMVEAVYDSTNGNPLFVREIAKSLQDERLSPGDTWSRHIPSEMQDAIKKRTVGLSDDCQSVLVTAAVIGRDFSLHLLRILLDDLSEDRILAALEEAMRAGLIEESPHSPIEFQFTHAVIQEAMSSEMMGARRLRLHARIGEALESIQTSGMPVPAIELAYHFGEAKPLIGHEKFVHYSIVAGQRALASYSYREASSIFREALASKEATLQGSLDQALGASAAELDDELASILCGLGLAQAALNQVSDGVRNLRTAFNYYERTGNVQRATAIAAYPHSVPFVFSLGDVTTRALNLVDTGSLQAGRVLANYGFFVGMTNSNYEPALKALEESLAIAQKERDAALEIRARAVAGEIAGEHLRWEECLDACLQTTQLTGDFDDSISRLRAHAWASVALNVQGKPDESNFHAEQARELATLIGDRFWQGISLLLLTAVAFDRGSWTHTRELSGIGLNASPNDIYLLALRSVMEYKLGDFEEGQIYLNRLVESAITSMRDGTFAPLHAGVLAIGAAYRATDGNSPGTEVALEIARRLLSPQRVSPNHALFIRTGLGLIAAQDVDTQLAQEQYNALSPMAGERPLSGEVNLDRVLGLLAATLGQEQQAEAHFIDAIEFGRESKYIPELAWSCYDYAELLSKRNDASSKDTAKELLSEASKIATDLSMTPLMERIDELNAKLSPSNKRGRYPFSLTKRQVEILCEAAKGKSSRQIADDLIISIHTVNRHLDNIYSKMGVNRRDEAVLQAERVGLLEECEDPE